MQNGDIGNTVVPRLVIVWEHLLGLLPDKADEAKFATYLRFHRWRRAVNVFAVNQALAQRIWDVTFRLNFSVDVVTFLGGEDFADAIQERIDRENLPIGHVWFEDPQQLARSLSYRPDIACVFSPDPHHLLTFGSKGRTLNPARPDLHGAM